MSSVKLDRPILAKQALIDCILETEKTVTEKWASSDDPPMTIVKYEFVEGVREAVDSGALDAKDSSERLSSLAVTCYIGDIRSASADVSQIVAALLAALETELLYVDGAYETALVNRVLEEQRAARAKLKARTDAQQGFGADLTG